MSELIGEHYLEERAAKRNEFNGVLQDYSADVCFARIWGRLAGRPIMFAKTLSGSQIRPRERVVFYY